MTYPNLNMAFSRALIVVTVATATPSYTSFTFGAPDSTKLCGCQSTMVSNDPSAFKNFLTCINLAATTKTCTDKVELIINATLTFADRDFSIESPNKIEYLDAGYNALEAIKYTEGTPAVTGLTAKLNDLEILFDAPITEGSDKVLKNKNPSASIGELVDQIELTFTGGVPQKPTMTFVFNYTEDLTTNSAAGSFAVGASALFSAAALYSAL